MLLTAKHICYHCLWSIWRICACENVILRTRNLLMCSFCLFQNKVCGIHLGHVVQGMGNLGTGLIIAFIASWKLSLVLLVIVPIMVLNGLMHTKLVGGISGKTNSLESSGKIVTETIVNIRTVASLLKEEYFHQEYSKVLQSSYRSALIKGQVTGLIFGFSQGALYFIFAAAFYYGAVLVENREVGFNKVLRVVNTLIVAASSYGQASAFTPELGKAKAAVERIFTILDCIPNSNAALDIGAKPEQDTFKYDIHFRDVSFAYCQRPDVRVLHGLSVSAEHGHTVALVGSSGCGKSTVIGLMMRFYCPDSGDVNLDNHNIADLNVQWLRTQIGLVTQEPVLFSFSIAENIAYGDNSRVVGMDEIIMAARKANIHNFIDALPEGYATTIGEWGHQLSGGQKQRIAIARALVRNPKILLLDEATSALDTESEKIVQEAIDSARKGRTCIVIAHRLSTIINSDKIVVIDKGAVVEQGTHNELLKRRGFYYKLHMFQNRRR